MSKRSIQVTAGGIAAAVGTVFVVLSYDAGSAGCHRA
jgi:hypothetical protein